MWRPTDLKFKTFAAQPGILPCIAFKESPHFPLLHMAAHVANGRQLAYRKRRRLTSTTGQS